MHFTYLSVKRMIQLAILDFWCPFGAPGSTIFWECQAGALGAAMLERIFQRGWIARVRSSRIVRITAKGREDVYKLLKLTL
jgi:hypothetical protein